MSNGADIANCSASEPFALRVIGDDMAPEFCDGQVIIVDPGGLITSGCYVIARLEGEMIFRQLIIDREEWKLHALNGTSVDLELPNQVADIVGVISQRAGTRRSQHKRYDG